MTLINFTLSNARQFYCLMPDNFNLSNARQFYSAMGNRLAVKGLNNHQPSKALNIDLENLKGNVSHCF